MPSTLDRLREHWLDQVGLLASGALSAVVVLRIFAVAHFDLLTAAAILQRGGTSNVLVGAVLASIPSLIAAAVPLLTAVVALSHKTTFRAAPVTAALWVVVMILWVLFVPWRIAAAVGASMSATSLLLLVLRRQKDRMPEALALDAENASFDNEVGRFATASERDAALADALEKQSDALKADSDAVHAELEALDAGVIAAAPETRAALERIRATTESIEARRADLGAKQSELQDRLERRIALLTARREKEKSLTLRNTRIVVGVMAVLACTILLSSSNVPWLPTERIESDRDEAFTGYVLNETDGNLVVLRARGRVVKVILSADDPHRALCDPTTRRSEESLIDVVRKDSYPSCPRG